MIYARTDHSNNTAKKSSPVIAKLGRNYSGADFNNATIMLNPPADSMNLTIARMTYPQRTVCPRT